MNFPLLFLLGKFDFLLNLCEDTLPERQHFILIICIIDTKKNVYFFTERNDSRIRRHDVRSPKGVQGTKYATVAKEDICVP